MLSDLIFHTIVVQYQGEIDKVHLVHSDNGGYSVLMVLMWFHMFEQIVIVNISGFKEAIN